MIPPPRFNQITIIGLGLIGGSLGLALRSRRVARKVFGVTRSARTLREAKKKGAIDEGSLCLADGVRSADLVVIATFPKSVVTVAQEISHLTRHPLILTDVASVKKEIVSVLEKKLPSRISFVGGHPMAGSERSGIEAADPQLFDGASCVLTKGPQTSREALTQVATLWRLVGGRVKIVTPSRHDALVAHVSHLPHLVAVGLTHSVSGDALDIAGGGFSDATRVALSHPDLWDEICELNRLKIMPALDRFIDQMKQIRHWMASRKDRELHALFRTAQKRRSQLQRKALRG